MWNVVNGFFFLIGFSPAFTHMYDRISFDSVPPFHIPRWCLCRLQNDVPWWNWKLFSQKSSYRHSIIIGVTFCGAIVSAFKNRNKTDCKGWVFDGKMQADIFLNIFVHHYCKSSRQYYDDEDNYSLIARSIVQVSFTLICTGFFCAHFFTSKW